MKMIEKVQDILSNVALAMVVLLCGTMLVSAAVRIVNIDNLKELELPSETSSDGLTIDLPTEPITAGKLIQLPIRNLEDNADSATVFCFPEATCFPSQWQGKTSIVFQATDQQIYSVLIIADGKDGYEYDLIELPVGEQHEEDKPRPDKADSLLIGIVYEPEKRDNQREWLEVITSKELRNIERATVELISRKTKEPELQRWAMLAKDDKPTLIIANENGTVLSVTTLPKNKSEAIQTIKGFLR